MSHLKSIQLAHVPPTQPVHVALYRDLQNAQFLREQLLAGNTEFEYAFIDASTILSTTHILAAVFRAVNDYQNNRLKSKNVHSEIVYSLSPNNNVLHPPVPIPVLTLEVIADNLKIAESFRKFGITDATKDLLVVKFSTSPDITHDSVAQHLEKAIEGKPLPFDNENLRLVSDISKIKKAYKLGSISTKAGQNGPDGPAGLASEINNLERSILGAMALRGS
ncbi:hypothetical protein FQN50_002649 [Emmonsiellopsis sp. PD_5]|nr:hypothetical protein FQN50_002649 [Emmonsiellopsis sp. PD_5]